VTILSTTSIWIGRGITDVNGFLFSMDPYHTSWTSDIATISVLLAGVDKAAEHSQQEIYLSVLMKFGNISDNNIFYSSAIIHLLKKTET
jgi:hypothetical protein